MVKLVSVTLVGFALMAVGCQSALAAPAQAPQASAAPQPPPPPPPNGHGPEMMPPAHDGPGGPMGHHEGGEAMGQMGHHHGEGDDGGKAGCEHCKGHGEHPRGPEGHGGPMGPGGEHEVMRELAGLGVHFYPPAMLIHRAQKIGLTPEQVTKIRLEMLSAQAHTVDLVAKIGHAKVEATRLLAADKVDERAVDAQIDEVEKAEGEMHKLRLGTALRVRALLTPEQRQKLEEHKSKHEGPKPAMGAGGQAPPVTGAADDDDDDDDDDADG